MLSWRRRQRCWLPCRRPDQAQQPAATAPTFSKDVAPILYKHCVSCHRPGEIAPMSLLTYEQARPYAKAIANAVTNRTMPPWHADAPAGTFHNERALTDRERQTLTAWAAGGAVNGDPKRFAGAADVQRRMVARQAGRRARDAGGLSRSGNGTIQYEWFYIPTNFTEAKWVKSIEVRPGNRAAVHHVLVYYRAKPDGKAPPIARANQKHQSNPPPDEPGVAEHPRRTDLTGMPPRLVATYAPGTNPQVAPAGTAFRLEPGGDHRAADALHGDRASRPRTGRRSASRSRTNRRRAKCARSIS